MVQTLLVLVRDLKLPDEIRMLGTGFFLRDADFAYYASQLSRQIMQQRVGLQLGEQHRVKLPETGFCEQLIRPGCRFQLTRLDHSDRVTLKYSPKPGFESILTVSAMQRYERLFGLLLEANMCLYELQRMHAGWRHQQKGERTVVFLRFRMEAMEFVSSVLRYFHEVGLAPWHLFLVSLDACEGVGVSAGGEERWSCPRGRDRFPVRDLKTLKEAHDSMLDQICWFLLLGPEQGSVLEVLRDIFSCIRFVCGLVGRAYTLPQLVEAVARLKGQIDVFVKVLTRMKHLDAPAGLGDATIGYGALESLLLFVNFNRYYLND
ncbi:hypothetical protein BC830DRAFT_497465 [Chytriomyces sp. MP71]|nr:hypothetical protein BC830DRAFT_497465 [Chytriomyces sp. MP71]